MEAALKKEAVQKKDTELEAFLIDMQTTAGSNDEVQSEEEAPCSYTCQNRAGVIFNIALILALLIVIILICAKMMLEN
jgi:hypothetical protein